MERQGSDYNCTLSHLSSLFLSFSLSLSPPPLFSSLSIYIYHQLANCSNLAGTVKMKTPRVRVHGNSVYYHIRQLEDYRWHANEPSIVPPQKQLIEKFCTSKQDQPCTRGKKPAGIELRKYVFDSRTGGGEPIVMGSSILQVKLNLTVKFRIFHDWALELPWNIYLSRCKQHENPIYEMEG